MLLITVALGVFALWRLKGIAENMALSGGQYPPQRAVTEGGRRRVAGKPNFYVADRPGGSAERNAQLEEKIAANTARRDELLKNYEPLLSDDEDRRLYEDAKRARDVTTASRGRALELLKQNKAEEFRNCRKTSSSQITKNISRRSTSILLTTRSLAKPMPMRARTPRSSAAADRPRPRPRLASGIPSGMAGHSFDKSSPQGHHGQPRLGGAPDRLGGPASIDGGLKPRFRGQ